MRMVITAAAVGAALIAASPAAARMLVFHATLGGHAQPTDTGSDASGTAKIRVDTVTQRVSVDLSVKGLTTDALADALVARPIGPIHFHEYKADGNVALVLPVPFGVAYRSTREGFRVTMHDYDYAAGARLVGTDTSFDGFVAAMRGGKVVLNVHTDKFSNGEISGTVSGG
jgi:hypothetical protein